MSKKQEILEGLAKAGEKLAKGPLMIPENNSWVRVISKQYRFVHTPYDRSNLPSIDKLKKLAEKYKNN